MSRFKRASVFAVLSVAAVSVGCKSSNSDSMSMSSSKTLYTRLGGDPAIRAVVDDFVDKAAHDPRVNFTRTNPAHPHTWDPSADDNMKRFKDHLVQFIEHATGGPQAYEGESMEKTHAGMEISDAEFNAIAEDLKSALDDYKVSQRDQDELLKIVGSTRGSIVGK